MIFSRITSGVIETSQSLLQVQGETAYSFISIVSNFFLLVVRALHDGVVLESILLSV